MKKLLSLLLLFVLVFSLSACTDDEEVDELNKDFTDQVLNVYFVPSRPAEEILTITAPLEQLLMDELAKIGYPVKEVNIFVSATYEAAGEAMLAGTADIGFLPGGTYVLYADAPDSEIDVMLTATRAGLNKDSSDAIDWNDGLETLADPEYQVTYYKGLMVAGVSAAGRALADKVNAGTELTWDDLSEVKWCVRSSTSSSGYIYPSIWLQENYGMSFDDMPAGNVIETGGYGDTMSNLAIGSCDVGTIYADARRDYADEWVGVYGRTDTVWDETDVIAVTSNIFNDTIAVSNVNVNEVLQAAITLAFMNIALTDEGQLVMAVYSHQGYKFAFDALYDNERLAQEMLFEEEE